MRCSIAIVLTLAWASPALAQVYEIGASGSVQVRDGGGAVVWRDANPLPHVTLAQMPSVGEKSSGALATGPDMASPVSDPETLLKLTAARYGLSPFLLEALVWQESRWRSNAKSPKGAVGLTQLMPGTASQLGVNPHDPVANLDGGARYLRQMLDRFGGDLTKALAAYNAGPGRVERAGGVPAIKETREYVAAILARLAR